MRDWNDIDISILLVTGHTLYQSACTVFYMTVHPYIMNKFCKRNEELANDIFLKILKSLPKFDRMKGKLSNFIFTIMKNEFLEFAGKKTVQYVQLSNHLTDKNNDELEMYDRMEFLLSKLSPTDRHFVETYVNYTKRKTVKKTTKETAKFFYLIEKLRKINMQNDQHN